MKKLILLVFTVLLTATSFAQGIDVGIKAGANFATLTDVGDTSTRTGLLIGAFVTLKFSDKLALQGDALYSQEGSEFDASEINLEYINFPIVLKYYVVKRLNIHAGPQFGFIVDADISTLIENIGAQIGTNTFNLSGVVGIGVDLPLGFRASGRYNFGLTDVFTNNIFNAKNNVFSIVVGYSFL